MNYVEIQRALRSLRVGAIILGVIVVLAVIGRIFSTTNIAPNNQIAAMESSSTATVSVHRLPNGTIETVIDDPLKHHHAVIERHGNLTRITTRTRETTRTARSSAATVTVRVASGSSGSQAYRRVPASIPINVLFLIGMFGGLVIASMLGCALSRENDGHLELAWTKPVSRMRYALGIIAYDCVAIIVAVAVTTGVAVGIVNLFTIPTFTFAAAHALTEIGIAFVGPLAWYALFTVATASLRQIGGIVALIWIAGVFLPPLAGGLAVPGMPGGALHPLVAAIAALDPIAYLSQSNDGLVVIGVPGGVESLWRLVALAVLFVVYLAGAVLQWRRLEA